ncbi:transcriptional regulator with XRE-family HTH domain [Erwinia persicina]|jgi:transcriptional regulator with XRE-family HTH domain|uniref:Helix-turn-helix domain-containing protein n=1 Tax=Erwinia aeris TaxID=3239803 RepID=A0ABV4EBB2_9GAMM|nr:helix-turn-helix domain-containing protein [Erwinia persicina]MCP1439687.1 transcriptional regulator with XRE-family HTH domain [Erwinia persicina]
MKTSALQRKNNIINNIDYIIKSRGETKVSFANRTGVTRATLYKILDGKVNNVQRSTITRIADFFGVSCEIIENHDLQSIELIENTLSPDGDKNPAAVPVIPQSAFLRCADKRVGQLVAHYPVTWFFGEVANTVALQVERNLGNLFFPGDVLIIKRHTPPQEKQLALFSSPTQALFVSDIHSGAEEASLLGAIIEERIQ